MGLGYRCEKVDASVFSSVPINFSVLVCFHLSPLIKGNDSSDLEIHVNHEAGANGTWSAG